MALAIIIYIKCQYIPEGSVESEKQVSLIFKLKFWKYMSVNGKILGHESPRVDWSWVLLALLSSVPTNFTVKWVSTR